MHRITKSHVIKAVLFDLGGTLIKTAPVPEIIRRILINHGIERSIREISKAHSETERQLSYENYAVLSDEYWIRWNMIILKKLKIHRNLEDLARAIAEEWWDYADIELYPDVKETLDHLKKAGLKLGVVTNGFESDVRAILPRVGLTSFFDVIVTIDMVGKLKPNKEIFLQALNKLKVDPEEVLFIGDILEIDYKGARRVGMNAVLIDRDDKVKKKVKKIRSLNEVMNHI